MHKEATLIAHAFLGAREPGEIPVYEPREYQQGAEPSSARPIYGRVIRIDPAGDTSPSEALFGVARRLNADLHLDAVLQAVCEETPSALRVPAASVSLLDDRTGALRVARTVGPAVDLQRAHARAATPLTRGGATIGILAALSPYEPRTFTPADRALLEAMADLASTAIANARMFEKVQRSAIELASAYDATLAGWSRALDLRDKETEGHSRRVAQLTVRLARECALPEEDLIHMHRGAVLHDIGKIAVPDAVLSKPGELTADEWAIMRRHPEYAHEMLAPIRYLRPALDIPYAHHERWDGSGYPCGLRAEEIPLPARVFAVADVWDSLTNDRPYRAAWPEEQVVGYLRDNAGILFDPSVVGIFLQSEPWRRAAS